MSTAIGMRFPPEFAEAFRERAELAGCFPAQRVQAMERLIDRRGLQLELLQEIAQVRAEAAVRLREGARLGGQSCPSNRSA